MKMKRMVCLTAALLLVTGSLLAKGSSDDAKKGKTFTVAVGWNAMDASTQKRMKYLTEELGPALGIKFIYSDVIADVGQMLTFIENSYSAGANAVLSTITDTEQIAAKCNEMGLYLATVSSTYSEKVAALPYNLGITGVDLKKLGLAYQELMSSKLDASKPKNFLIISGGAGLGVASHIEATATMLEQIQKIYGLKYKKDIQELTKLRATTNIETGTGVKVTIVPGFPNMDGYVQGITNLLQTGAYDVMLSVYQTTSTFATAVEEVEKALNKNIMVMCTASFGPPTKTAFETLDPTGNSSLDGAVLNAQTVTDAIAIMMIYNALTGNVKLIKPDGRAASFRMGAMVVKNQDEYRKIEKLDTGPGTWCYNADEIKKMIAVFNPAVTTTDILAVLNKFSTSDLIARRGF